MPDATIYQTPQGPKTYAEIVTAAGTLRDTRETARDARAAEAVARDEAGGIALTQMTGPT